jgi:hypothetical protein
MIISWGLISIKNVQSVFLNCLWHGNADLKLELNKRYILNVGSIVHMNSVLGRFYRRVSERINIDSPPSLCLPYAYLYALTQIVTCTVAFVPCTGFLFSWFVVGIVEDDM